jgi:hypothetical protein
VENKKEDFDQMNMELIYVKTKQILVLRTKELMKKLLKK